MRSLSATVFALALGGLFVFGNFLMIGGHRPYRRILGSSFVYPFPGKGGWVYVSKYDLVILTLIVAGAIISAAAANWAQRRIHKAAAR
jgi:hypothetical protein